VASFVFAFSVELIVFKGYLRVSTTVTNFKKVKNGRALAMHHGKYVALGKQTTVNNLLAMVSHPTFSQFVG
jgi:hypothetical protein